MRRLFFIIFIILFLDISTLVSGQEDMTLRVRDELTTFPAVETFVHSGNLYWGDKALGTLFGASLKKEGENLVILCRDALCAPFYMDDPLSALIQRRGKTLLLASKAAEVFGYKRLEWDREAQEIRLYKFPKPAADAKASIPLMDLYLPDASGQITFLSRYKGKKLIIFIWAPWDPSREALPSWNRFLSEMKDHCHYVFIAETIEGRERMEPYLSALKPRPLCLLDAGFRATFHYQLEELPALLLVDEKGNLVLGPLSVKGEDIPLREAISLWVKDASPPEILRRGPAIKGYPASIDVEESVKRFELAQILWNFGKIEEALEEYNRAASRFPDQEIIKGQRRALLEPLVYYPPPPTSTPDKSPEP